MIQIKYKEIESLTKAYLDLISNISISLELKEVSKTERKIIVEKYNKLGGTQKELCILELYNFFLQNDSSFKNIFKDKPLDKFIISGFEDNKNLSQELGEIEKNDYDTIVKQIFNYSLYQPRIAKFFEAYIKPTTCYFCNIDFINVFGKYEDVFDFIKTATIEEFEDLKDFAGYKDLILKIQKEKTTFQSDKDLIEEFGEDKLEKIEQLYKSKVKTYNGFTLDHVIDKATYPYLSLSIFNLVPSCYICNSKLKGSKPIGDVSPSSKNFDFHEKVKFKTYFSTNNDKLLIEKQDDVEVYLKEYASEPKYKDYIEVFRLNERYRFHRYRVIEMIDKRKRYPDSRIQELANLTGQTPMQVKKDLFGEYLFENDPKDQDLSKRPLAKLTRDIAEELGLI